MHVHLCSVVVEDGVMWHMASHNERTCGRVFPRSTGMADAWEVTMCLLPILIQIIREPVSSSFLYKDELLSVFNNDPEFFFILCLFKASL